MYYSYLSLDKYQFHLSSKCKKFFLGRTNISRYYSTHHKSSSSNSRSLGLIPESVTFTRSNSIELLLRIIELLEEPEEDAGHSPRNNSDSSEQVLELGLNVDTGQGQVDRGREGVLDLGEGHDDGLHALGSLGEGVFEGGDGGKDLGNGDENVRTGDDPDVQRRVEGLAISVTAFRGLKVVARRSLVEVMLQDRGPNHTKTRNHETDRDPLQGCETDVVLAKGGVNPQVKEGNQYNERDRVQVPSGGIRNQADVERIPTYWIKSLGVPRRVIEPAIVPKLPSICE